MDTDFKFGLNRQTVKFVAVGYLAVVLLAVVVAAAFGVFAPAYTDAPAEDNLNVSHWSLNEQNSEVHRVTELSVNASSSDDALHLASEAHYTPGEGLVVEYWSGDENRSAPYSSVYINESSNTLYKQSSRRHMDSSIACNTDTHEYAIRSGENVTNNYQVDSVDFAFLRTYEYEEVEENVYRAVERDFSFRDSNGYVEVRDASGSIRTNDAGVIQQSDLQINMTTYGVYGGLVRNSITGGTDATIELRVEDVQEEPTTAPEWVSQIPDECVTQAT